MDYVIIVAGGKGLRMGTDIPKQFLPVKGLPVLMRTIKRFREYSDSIGIILVLPEEQHGYWKELCERYGFDERYIIAGGGETRFHSVNNGLALIPDDACGVVGVHDGVRPFASVEVIKRCFDEAREKRAVIPVTPVVETLRHVKDTADGDVEAGGQDEPRQADTETVPRDRYMLVQTPQTFDIQLLKRAYRQAYTPAFTDDASVVEAMGHTVAVTPGNRENIKITTPFDLKISETLV